MERIDYAGRQHTVYAAGRALSGDVLANWMGTFAGYAPAERPLPVLDLGSGTGRFTPALADTFGGPVFGVEPARSMRQIAERDAPHAQVRYLDGAAEEIPLPDNSCGLVLMFLSFHHFPDRQAAAAEIARVLAPNGRVLLRSMFADRMRNLRWHHFFPRAKEIEERIFPTVAEVTAVFAEAGLRRIALSAVPVRLADNLTEYADRLRLRAISTFEYLTEAETEQGFAALDAALAAETEPTPVDSTSDLLVLG
ncbi:MAG TPA: class I SAM-dependent methyltransferase [Pseudonocardiaceae bacterium]|jgi:ubiquinone/menaquinone biosynthesis C-methylase UbiE|nr:class I SAM-dependent methyltransferase [Pseudonocardiaceae bacterium]